MNTPKHTPNDLRAACLEYLLANAEPDDGGGMYAETPAGLRILYGSGWMSAGGTVVNFAMNGQLKSEVDYSIEWVYEDPASPHVIRTEWPDHGADQVAVVHWVDHNQVATSLMKLFALSEDFAAAS